MLIKVTSDIKANLAWRRLMAQAIDVAIVFLLVIILHAFWRVPGPIFTWVFVAIYLLYCILMDCYYNGTIGKLYVNLKIIHISNYRSKLLTSIYRNISKVCFSFFVLNSIPILAFWGLTGIHNKMAGCIVVDNRAEKNAATKNPPSHEMKM